MPNLFNDEYLFFWGNTQKEGIDKSCLSQWYPAPFIIDNVEYKTTEQYMMYRKALLFNDEERINLIMATNSPKEAKRLGRLVENFKFNVWIKHAFDIVLSGNNAKFSQNKEIGDYLKSTGDKHIVEASPYDKVWGIGMDQNHPDILDPSKWKGENLLGKVLMKVRDNI